MDGFFSTTVDTSVDQGRDHWAKKVHTLAPNHFFGRREGLLSAAQAAIASELRDELPRFWGIPAHRLTGIPRLPSVRAVEDAVYGWMSRGAVLVDRARVRLAGGWEGHGPGLRRAAVDRGELRLFHFAARRQGRTAAVSASLRGIVGDGLRQGPGTRAGE